MKFDRNPKRAQQKKIVLGFSLFFFNLQIDGTRLNTFQTGLTCLMAANVQSQNKMNVG
jgi:hypothetical protein